MTRFDSGENQPKPDHASEHRLFPVTDDRERLLNHRMVSDAFEYLEVGTGSNFCDLADGVSRVKLVETIN